MPKIYTKTGDKGKTSMFGGKRVCKCCLEMEAIGEVDELNAFLGLLIARLVVIPAKAGIQKRKKEKSERFLDSRLRGNDSVVGKLIGVQHNLFTIGANLAALQTDLVNPEPQGYRVNVPKLGNSKITKLEQWIDEMESELPKLQNFILPGGCEEAALSFYVRAVCRRAERCIISLSKKHRIDPLIKQYLNRLSDCLFILGRWINFKSGVEEIKWRK